MKNGCRRCGCTDYMVYATEFDKVLRVCGGCGYAYYERKDYPDAC